MRNIDMSSLTPAQRQEAELMQQFTNTPEMRQSFTMVNLAEKILPHLLVNEHRQEPKIAAQAALAYARAMHDAGEASMQDCFTQWKASRPTEPAPALDESEPDSDPVGGVVQEETISRDAAVADTELRTGRGEDVTSYKDSLQRVDDGAVANFGRVPASALDEHQENITDEELLKNMAAGGASQPG
jgi:hypothetical protein